MQNKLITWAIIRAITHRGNGHLKEFLDNCARSNDLSRELLLQIVRDNQNTEYGKKWANHFFCGYGCHP